MIQQSVRWFEQNILDAYKYFLSIIKRMVRMSTIALMVWVGILLQMVSGDSLIKSTFIQGTSCTFYYSNHTATFAFYNCYKQQDKAYFQWNECMTTCCPKMPNGNHTVPTLYTLQLCKSYNPIQEDTQLGIIIMTIMVIIFAVVLLICFCVMVCKVCRSIDLRNRRVANQIQEITQVEWIEEKVFCDKLVDLKWSQLAQKHNKLKESDAPCSICLDEDTRALLFCQHQYHPHCIGGWLKKSRCCPCCRMQNIRGIKIYCVRCRWRYAVCSRNVVSQHGGQLPKLCGVCEGEQLIRESVLGGSSNIIFCLDNSQSPVVNPSQHSHAMIMGNQEY